MNWIKDQTIIVTKGITGMSNTFSKKLSGAETQLAVDGRQKI